MATDKIDQDWDLHLRHVDGEFGFYVPEIKINENSNNSISNLEKIIISRINHAGDAPLVNSETSDPFKKLRISRYINEYASYVTDTAKRLSTARNDDALVSIAYDLGHAQGTFDNRMLNIASTKCADLKFDETEKIYQLTLKLPESSKDSQLKLYVEIKRAIIVYYEIFARKQRSAKNDYIINKLRDQYNRFILEIYEIAKSNLSSDDAAETGIKQISNIKDTIVLNESSFIKNGYITLLGRYSFLFLFISLILFFSMYVIANQVGFVDLYYYNISLSMSFSSIGVWLSFSLRKINLTFEDLYFPESDFLSPLPRLFLVSILTGIIALIIQIGFFEIKISDKPIIFSGSPNISIIFGLFCGLSERAISNLISKQSSNFFSSGSDRR